MATISGRIPQAVESQIQKLMQLYSSNFTSLLAQFPQKEIAQVIDKWVAQWT